MKIGTRSLYVNRFDGIFPPEKATTRKDSMMPRILATALFSLLLVLGGCSTLKPSMKASPSLFNFLGISSIPVKDLERMYVNEDSKFMEIDDMKIHYRDVGEGPTVILIHGLFSSLHTWDGWVDEMRGHFRVITLDLPGFGLTGAPEDMDKYTEEYVLLMFSKFVDYMDLEKVSLAGNSFGAYIAARYAASNPDRVEQLILLDPVGYPHERPWVFGLPKKPGLNVLTKFSQPPFIVTMNLEQVYGDIERLSKSNHYRYIHMSQRPGAKAAYLKAMTFLSDENAIQPFASIRAPTLLMWGVLDRWVPISQAELWRKDVSNTQFISYPGVGHVPMEELPYQTAQDAIAFMSALNPKAALPAPKMDELEDMLKGGEFSEGFETMEGL